jgi:hypothetical protein
MKKKKRMVISKSEREALWDYLALVIPQSTSVEQEKRREKIKDVILNEKPISVKEQSLADWLLLTFGYSIIRDKGKKKHYAREDRRFQDILCLIAGPHHSWPDETTDHENPPGHCIIPEKEK